MDALVFTTGIGEHAARIRENVCRRAEWLGVHLDAAANAAGGPRITTEASPTSAWVIPTDEEKMIGDSHAERAGRSMSGRLQLEEGGHRENAPDTR